MRLSGSAILGLLSAVRATTEFETIVTEEYYSDKGCNDLIFGIPFSHHSNECVKMGDGDRDPFRYEMSVCEEDGTIAENLYLESDPECQGEPYETYKIKHDSCLPQIQFGEKVYVKQTLQGHCQGARTCDNGWECEEEWQLMEYEEGAQPFCKPFGGSKSRCEDVFGGIWNSGDKLCEPPAVDGEGDCAGSWVRSHEGSRVARCMFPQATCPGCGYNVQSVKFRCKGTCAKSSKRVPGGEKAPCSCSASCQGALGWMLKPSKKSGKKAKCYCYASTGEGAELKISKLIQEVDIGKKGIWISTDTEGTITE